MNTTFWSVSVVTATIHTVWCELWPQQPKPTGVCQINSFQNVGKKLLNYAKQSTISKDEWKLNLSLICRSHPVSVTSCPPCWLLVITRFGQEREREVITQGNSALRVGDTSTPSRWHFPRPCKSAPWEDLTAKNVPVSSCQQRTWDLQIHSFRLTQAQERGTHIAFTEFYLASTGPTHCTYWHLRRLQTSMFAEITKTCAWTQKRQAPER